MKGLLIYIALLLAIISAKRKLPSLEAHVDPDFVNATLTRTFSTLQLVTKSKIINLLNVPDVRQATYYTCGPSSLQAVLMYYGMEEIESEIAEMAHAD